jgi:tripartite-type tricarboxylate transporter receptor subunit TctC
MCAVSRLLLLSLAFAAPQAAGADAWPSRPIKLIAPVSAGIATDVVARMLAERMSRGLGQQVYVENVPGASGTLGTAAAARAAPDGYTLLFGSSGMLSTNKFLFKSLPFDLDRDFAPVSIVCKGTPFAVSVYPGLFATSLPELIALAKAQPGKLSYAVDISSGWAGMIGDLLNRQAGIEMVQVPYKTTSQAISDTMAGTTQVMIGSAMSIQGFVEAGKLRRIAITAAQRFPGMEDSAPAVETLPGFVFEGWFAVVAPAGTPLDIVARVHQEIAAFQSEPEAAKRLSGFGCIPAVGATPQSTAEFLAGERERWRKITQDLGVQPQ